MVRMKRSTGIQVGRRQSFRRLNHENQRIGSDGAGHRTRRFGKEGPGRSDLSDEARRIGSLGKAAAVLPDVRTGKVEAVRQSIEDGVYEVDARLLAGKILEFEDGFGR